jgi:nicotinamidase/pyrazinamidase
LKKSLNLKTNKSDVFIIADVQNDFLPGGALAIKESNQILPILNEYIEIFKNSSSPIIATRDWHPLNHVSFLAQGGLWPPHCIQDTDGAKFSPSLKLPESITIVSKATNPEKEAYSIFDGTKLSEQLKSEGIVRIFIGGLATDYCIVNSVLDARAAGFDVVVLADATCAINLNPNDGDNAFEKMILSGASKQTLVDFPEPMLLPDPEDLIETTTDKPLLSFDARKKARMRPKGSIKVRRERG